MSKLAYLTLWRFCWFRLAQAKVSFLDQWPFWLFTSLLPNTHIQVAWLICLPRVYFISSFADKGMAALFLFPEVWQLSFIRNKPDAYYQYKPKHVSINCFPYSHGSRNRKLFVNEIRQPSKSSHRVCARRNSILGIPAQKLKQENTFELESLGTCQKEPGGGGGGVAETFQNVVVGKTWPTPSIWLKTEWPTPTWRLKSHDPPPPYKT